MAEPDMVFSDTAAVLIGRNEGERLLRCLASAKGLARVVYVDSGSTDGSVAAAEAAGAEVVALDMCLPFTAARARNAGIARLRDGAPPRYIQFVDGDCVLEPFWIATARAFLEDRPEVAVVCGRRREIHPEASLYNRLCDVEWDTPVGRATACGGDALMRMAALDQVGGYRETMIAGEEPELCLRLGRRGWQIWRLEAEMTRHDAAITRFGQWWARTRRAGHAWAEAAALHGRGPERHGVAGTIRALFWGLGLPLAVLVLALLTGPWALVLMLIYPLQILRMAWRDGLASGFAWQKAALTMLGKIPEALGVLAYARGCLTQRRTALIEYK